MTVGNPPPYQVRVHVEKEELDDKIHNLRTAINGHSVFFASLPQIDQALMIERLGAMVHYSKILEKRIARFNGELI